MVNNNDLINLINNKKPVELVQELKDYEIKKSPLSLAARNKVVKKYGGDYQSPRIDSRDIALMQMYGPGFWDDFVKPIASGALVVASIFPPTAAVAAPIALGVAGAGLVATGVGHATDSEGWKEAGKNLIEIGSGAHDAQGMLSTRDAPLTQYARSRSRK